MSEDAVSPPPARQNSPPSSSAARPATRMLSMTMQEGSTRERISAEIKDKALERSYEEMVKAPAVRKSGAKSDDASLSSKAAVVDASGDDAGEPQVKNLRGIWRKAAEEAGGLRKEGQRGGGRSPEWSKAVSLALERLRFTAGERFWTGGEERPAYVLLPTDVNYKMWWLFTCVLVVLICIFSPFKFAFQGDVSISGPGGSVQILIQCMDVCFVIDIIINFRLAYFGPDGLLVKDPRKIAARYLRFAFWVDVLATLPVDYFFSDEDAVSKRPDIQVWKALSLLRLIRIKRIFSFVQVIEEQALLSYVVTAAGKFIFTVLILGHWAACAFYYMAFMNDFDPTTWAHAIGSALYDTEVRTELIDPVTNDFDFHLLGREERWIISAYWAFTTFTTVGYGDISPKNTNEMVFGSIFMLLNLAVTSYILGNMTLLATKGDTKISEYRDGLESLRIFAARRKLPAELTQMLMNYEKLQFMVAMDKDAFLDKYPASVSLPIKRHLYGSVLENCPLFRNCSRKFLDSLVGLFHVEHFFVGMVLSSPKHESANLMIILSGKAKALWEDKGEGESGIGDFTDGNCGKKPAMRVVRKLGPLMTVGESHVVSGIDSSFMIKTVTNVTALCVSTLALGETMRLFPRDHRQVQMNLLRGLATHKSTLMRKDRENQRNNVPPEKCAYLGVLLKEIFYSEMDVVIRIQKYDEDLVQYVNHLVAVNNVKDLRSIIESGFNPNTHDYNGRTPLHSAAYNGAARITRYLLEAGADPNPKDNMGHTPLYEAVKKSRGEVAVLLRENGGELLMSDENMFHELQKAIKRGDSMLLKRYLACGVPAGLFDGNGRTLLHEACVEGNSPAITVLLRYGCPKDAKDVWGNSAQSEAMRNGYGGIAKKIEEYASTPAEQAETSIFNRSLSGFDADLHSPYTGSDSPRKGEGSSLDRTSSLLNTLAVSRTRSRSGGIRSDEDASEEGAREESQGRGPHEILLALEKTPATAGIPEGQETSAARGDDGPSSAEGSERENGEERPNLDNLFRSTLERMEDSQRKRVEELVGENFEDDELFEEEELPSGEIEDVDMGGIDMGLGQRWREPVEEG